MHDGVPQIDCFHAKKPSWDRFGALQELGYGMPFCIVGNFEKENIPSEEIGWQ